MAQEEPPPTPILPLEIVAEVISRLPPKDILRFKAVSKAWLSLISHPNFVKQHLRKSASDSAPTRLKIVAAVSAGRKYSFVPINSLMSVEDEMRGSKYDKVEIGCPNSRIVGSCDGLMCLTAGESEIFVWNPAIRRLRKLPNSGIRERLGSLCHRGFIYGFGYDEVNNDYNVVMMVSAIGIYHDREVEVYSMRSNRWRRIGDFPYGPHHEAGLSVCGALVWPAISTSAASTQSLVCGVPVLNIEWKIVALDLGSGTYRDMPQPAGVQALRDKLLGVMDGCLCIFAHFRGTRLEIWMMKEFGVQDSWAKVATVPYLVKPCWSDELPFYMPLWCSKDEEMIILFRSKFIVYNMRDGTFKYPNVRELNILSQPTLIFKSRLNYILLCLYEFGEQILSLLHTRLVSLSLYYYIEYVFTDEYQQSALFPVLWPLYVYQQKHPLNLIFLGLFTACLSVSVGVTCANTDGSIVLEALILTSAVVSALTAYTFWASKKGRDFSYLGPILFSCLMVLVVTGFMQIFFPLGPVSNAIYGGIGAMIFSGYIVYDTDNLIKRHTYDQYTWASVTLYLDILNLFLTILRMMRSSD